MSPPPPPSNPASAATEPTAPVTVTDGAPHGEEDDDSRAGSMTLLLPTVECTPNTIIMAEKQIDSVLPMPDLPSPRTLQRPRRRPVVADVNNRFTHGPGSCSCAATTLVLSLLAAAAIMAAVAAAAIAMASRTEVIRLRTDVDHLRERLSGRDFEAAFENYIHRVMEPGMAPVQIEEEDVVWDGQDPTGYDGDLSPSYPEEKEYEPPVDIKGKSASTTRHRRRHIPMVDGAYVSSESGWRAGDSEKRLKLYEALTKGTLPPVPVPVPAVPPPPVSSKPIKLVSVPPPPQRSTEAPYNHRSSSGRILALSATPATVVFSPSDKSVLARRQDIDSVNSSV